MIVVCERCQTRFELDDAKVPSSGVRVRCSRCKHAFLVSSSATAAEPGSRPTAVGADLEAETDGDWTFNDGRAPTEPDEGPRVGAAELPRGAPSGGFPEPRTIDELGSPESWDFLGEDDSLPPSAEGLAEPIPAVGASKPPLAGPGTLAAPPAPVEPAAAEAAERVSAPPDRWLEGAGWIVAAALCLFAIHGVLSAGTAAPRVPERVAVGGLQADRIEGRFVENAVAGRLLVVTGRLRNPARTPTPVGGRLQLALVAGDGMRIGSPAAFVGHVLAEGRLREDSPARLRESLAESARHWAEEPFEPDEVRAFSAVFEDVPTEAERIVFDLAPERGAGGFAAARRSTGLLTESVRTFLPSPPPSSE